MRETVPCKISALAIPAPTTATLATKTYLHPFVLDQDSRSGYKFVASAVDFFSVASIRFILFIQAARALLRKIVAEYLKFAPPSKLPPDKVAREVFCEFTRGDKDTMSKNRFEPFSDANKTLEQLILELAEMRGQVAELRQELL